MKIQYLNISHLFILKVQYFSGGGGIRTPEEFPLAGFQDRCNQPGSATPPNRLLYLNMGTEFMCFNIS